MTTDTLTHDVHGTKVRYQLNKTPMTRSLWLLRTGHGGHKGPQGPFISLCFSFTRVIELRVAHARVRARLDRQKTVFSILNHIYLQTMKKWHFFTHKLRWIKEWVLVTCGVLWLDLVFSSILLYFNLRPLCLRPEPLWTLNTPFFRSRDQPRP